jgi:hypothetical protein
MAESDWQNGAKKLRSTHILLATALLRKAIIRADKMSYIARTLCEIFGKRLDRKIKVL